MPTAWRSDYDESLQREAAIAFLDELFQHMPLDAQAELIEETQNEYDEDLFEILMDVVTDFTYQREKLYQRLYDWEQIQESRYDT